MQSLKIRSILVTLLLAALALFQAARYARETLPALLRVRSVAGQPARWRGAAFNQGDAFAGYITFLNDRIPTRGRVVLPPADARPAGVGVTPYMQFYLAPRPVINCADQECVDGLDPSGTYFLIVDDFPGLTPAGFGAPQAYNLKWGYLPPANETLPLPPGLTGFASYTGLLRAAILPLSWLALLCLCGAAWAVRLLPGAGRGLWLGLGAGLGPAGFTLGMALLSLAGLPLNLPVLLGLTGVMLAGVLFAVPHRSRFSPRLIRLGWENLAAGVLIAGFAGIAALLSIGRAYSVSDEIILWGAKGYGIAASGSLQSATAWGTNTAAYPLHLPALIAAFQTLFGETLPASKLVPPLYYAALLGVTYTFLARSGLRRVWALLLLVLLAATPLIARHATINYANLPLAYAVLCGVLFLSQRDARSRIAGGLFLAVAAWVRPEGLVFAWLLGGLVVLTGRGGSPVRRAAQALGPLAVYSLFWLVLSRAVYLRPVGQTGLAAAALEGLLAGQWHLGDLAYILRSMWTGLFDMETWGLAGGAVLVGVLWAAARLRRLPRRAGLLLACGLLYALGIAGMYFITSYDAVHDIGWWLNTGLERMLLPAALLSGLGGAASLKLLDDRIDHPHPLHLEQDGRPGV